MSEMHALTASYVADALDIDELAEFDAHLETCESCREEVAELREVMAEVGARHASAPPPMLRASILSAISTTPMLPAQDEQVQPGTESSAEQSPPPSVITSLDRHRRTRRPIATWLAAAAAVAAVALGGVTVWQQTNVQSLEAADARRVELLTAPDLQVDHTTLDGVAVTYLVSSERGEGLLTASALPDPGADRSWQVWVMQDDVPRSGAIVDRGGQVQQWVTGVAGGEALAITNEPRGGSPAPTGVVLAAVAL
ncbi:anti-sigma factor [Tessaracoccus sp.]